MRADLAEFRIALRGAVASHRHRALPAEVDATIRRQDASSEVLIRLIQLAIVLFFATLYLVAPRTDAATDFRVVPYALGVYLALTIAALVWSMRRELPEWAILASIVLDIGLLMLLIWSFHVQYDQPASFYLKVPTFLYVFIFIALRALRFEPRFVLFAGFVASVGWLGMVVYVPLSDRTGMVITRDYVEYLTSNSVLIGAEIDKVVSVLVVTAVLWLALRRARNLLIDSVAEGSAAANLSRFFDAPIASRIRLSDASALAKGVRREAAVLFVDLRGFTRLAAKLEPDAVIALLSAYRHQVGVIVHRNNGAIDKFQGDGIMAMFGTVNETSTYAADALRAVDEIVAAASTWGEMGTPLEHLSQRSLGTAMVAGSVVFGSVGAGDRLEFTVVGPSVNLAAKLEKYNKVSGTRALTTAETYDLALAQGYRPATAVEPPLGLPADTFGQQRYVVLWR
jgi:adenylate cyclase